MFLLSHCMHGLSRLSHFGMQRQGIRDMVTILHFNVQSSNVVFFSNQRRLSMPKSINFRSKQFFRIVLIGWLIVGFCAPIALGADKVNINTAGKEQLMTLKFVGEVLAERIMEYRTDHPFHAPEEIMNVKGVGEKIFETNKDRIIVKDE